MKPHVLISGASIAGLTLAYWLNKYNYQVTIVELSNGLRRGGSPIDVRGEALKVAQEMGIWEKIKAKEFVHTDRIVNTENETLVEFSINDQAEYTGDIEIHRDDLVDILYESLPENKVEFLFENSISEINRLKDTVEIGFKNGQNRQFDFVFGADGTHSNVRRLIFGAEKKFSKSFDAYFAYVFAPQLKTEGSGAVMYAEPNKRAALYPFKNTLGAALFFRASAVDYDHKDDEQQRRLLRENFKNGAWKIPKILDAMLQSNNLYFDEVCQIQMPSWSKSRVALVGDAAYSASFPTGMGTSLAMQGAAILAKNLDEATDYPTAFANYYHTFKPTTVTVQSRIERGLNWLLPKTKEGVEESIDRFKRLE